MKENIIEVEVSRPSATVRRSIGAKYPIVCAGIALNQLDATLSVFVEQERVTEYIEEQTCCLVESGVKYWSCRFCEKYNRDKRDIQRHIEAAHVQTSPYICLLCQSQFKTRRSLQRHETAMHK